MRPFSNTLVKMNWFQYVLYKSTCFIRMHSYVALLLSSFLLMKKDFWLKQHRHDIAIEQSKHNVNKRLTQIVDLPGSSSSCTHNFPEHGAKIRTSPQSAHLNIGTKKKANAICTGYRMLLTELQELLSTSKLRFHLLKRFQLG